MKNLKRNLLFSLLSYSLIFPMGILPAQAHAETIQIKKVSKQRLIKNSVKELKIILDSGRSSVDAVVANFTDQMLAANVEVADLEQFVRMNSSSSEFLKFQEAIAAAKNNLSEEYDAEEFGQVAGAALNAIDSEGLAWSGCGGLTAGVIILVGAVVVGIIALSKSQGVERLQAKYERKRSSRYNSYVNEVDYHKNAEYYINRDINSYKSKINSAQNDISYLTGKLVNEDDADERARIGNQIESLNNDISSYRRKIENLYDKKARYAQPGYRERQIAQALVDYEADIASLISEEERRIALVPRNQELAKTLGIISGISAAIGGYLALDGAQSCY